jgi:hypothetical protein
MSTFWPCGTCETTNPMDVVTCDVCGAAHPKSGARGARARLAAPPPVAGAKDTTTFGVIPLRLPGVATTRSTPSARVRPTPAPRTTPVRVDRRTTATPPTWKVQQAKIRRRVIRLLTSIGRAVREFLRA